MAEESLILFIDAQNFYNGARRAFFSPSDSHLYGQFKPMELANLICSSSPPGIPRKVHQVRIYTGSPDATKEPKTYAAHMKQRQTWLDVGAKVITRTLRYPEDWPASKAQQKGIDVALAIDFVALALDGEYDVGVIASTDSDLKPALEYVHRKCIDKCHIEVAAWISSQSKSMLTIPSSGIWYHRLKMADYDSIADLVDYNI